MSFLDAALGFFADNAATIIPAVAQVGSAIVQTSAAKDAAEEARKGYEAQAAAQREGNRLAQERYEAEVARSGPAVDYLRRLVAQDPSQLTPEQQTMRADVARGAQARLASSGLRGSGRSGIATINKADRDFMDRAFTQNTRRSDAAARQLAGANFQQTGALANIDRDTGRATGQAARLSGESDADMGIANSAIVGQTLGSLASIFAREAKARSGAYPNQRPREAV